MVEDIYVSSMTASALLDPAKRNSTNSLLQSILSTPALKYTWEISQNSLAYLDIKLSVNGNGLSTRVHYKPTDSHNYLLHSSSHPRSRSRNRTKNVTEQRNQQNSIHPHLPSKKPCSQKCHSQKLKNSPQ